MGSSSSKPRKGHKNTHLPKVGSPKNQEWEHKGRVHDVFGGTGTRILLVLLLVFALLGLVLFAV